MTKFMLGVKVGTWLAGAHIQRAYKSLTADERELLISGTCGPCFDSLFEKDEEQGEEDTYNIN